MIVGSTGWFGLYPLVSDCVLSSFVVDLEMRLVVGKLLIAREDLQAVDLNRTALDLLKTNSGISGKRFV